jgi:hypothetical protein
MDDIRVAEARPRWQIVQDRHLLRSALIFGLKSRAESVSHII